MFQGAKKPGSEWARERISYGAKRPGSELARVLLDESSWEQIGPWAKRLWILPNMGRCGVSTDRNFTGPYQHTRPTRTRPRLRLQEQDQDQNRRAVEPLPSECMLLWCGLQACWLHRLSVRLHRVYHKVHHHITEAYHIVCAFTSTIKTRNKTRSQPTN